MDSREPGHSGMRRFNGPDRFGPPSDSRRFASPFNTSESHGTIQREHFAPIPQSPEQGHFGPMSNGESHPRNAPEINSPAPFAAGPPHSSYRNHPVPADTSRMQQALRKGDFEAIGKESQGVRSRTENLQDFGSKLPVQDRLKLPLINQMYRQGTNLVDEGRNKRDESKIRMGIQQINEANKKLGRLQGITKNAAPPPPNHQ